MKLEKYHTCNLTIEEVQEKLATVHVEIDRLQELWEDQALVHVDLAAYVIFSELIRTSRLIQSIQAPSPSKFSHVNRAHDFFRKPHDVHQHQYSQLNSQSANPLTGQSATATNNKQRIQFLSKPSTMSYAAAGTSLFELFPPSLSLPRRSNTDSKTMSSQEGSVAVCRGGTSSIFFLIP